MLLKLENITRETLLIDLNEKRYRNAISKMEIENPLSYNEFIGVIHSLAKTANGLPRTQLVDYNARQFYSHRVEANISFAEYIGTMLDECSIESEYQDESLSSRLRIVSDDGEVDENDESDDFSFPGGTA